MDKTSETGANAINEKHRGKLLEHIVRSSPYSIKVLSKKLGISRTTLYNKFQAAQLDYDFLLQVSKIVHYDFKDKLPQFHTQLVVPVPHYSKRDIIIDKKYIQLLEGYQRLFGFLVKTAHKYGLEYTRNELDRTSEHI